MPTTEKPPCPCGKPVRARGMCEACYGRAWRFANAERLRARYRRPTKAPLLEKG